MQSSPEPFPPDLEQDGLERRQDPPRARYEEPFASLLGSHKGSMVEPGRCVNRLPLLDALRRQASW